jgi:predicted nucleotidyltransferase
MTPEELATRLRAHPATGGVRLLVLHGSRANGRHHPGSDWDFGVLTDGATDLAALTAALTELLGTDAVDLVDLARASALLRYRAARDGIALLEARRDEFVGFQIEASQYWCDAGPVIKAAQEAVLAALGDSR